MARKNNKRTVDNWKKKRWFEIFADTTFDGKQIAETVAIEPAKLVGRKVRKSLRDLTGSIRDSYYEVTFKIFKVTATKADTEICKFETKSNFLRRMLRKGKSKIEPVFTVTTKDERDIRLKVLFITGAKYTTLQRREAQKAIKDEIIKEINSKTLSENWNDITHQNYTAKLKKLLIKIGFVNKIFVSKATLIK
jgi:small subunit ribosomal protein S3Ae